MRVMEGFAACVPLGLPGAVTVAVMDEFASYLSCPSPPEMPKIRKLFATVMRHADVLIVKLLSAMVPPGFPPDESTFAVSERVGRSRCTHANETPGVTTDSSRRPTRTP